MHLRTFYFQKNSGGHSIVWAGPPPGPTPANGPDIDYRDLGALRTPTNIGCLLAEG